MSGETTAKSPSQLKKQLLKLQQALARAEVQAEGSSRQLEQEIANSNHLAMQLDQMQRRASASLNKGAEVRTEPVSEWLMNGACRTEAQGWMQSLGTSWS